MIGRILSSVTHKIYTLPVLVLMPHSRCNCRCVMCDIWKANAEKRELSADEIQHHLQDFNKFGVKRIALSGGEALMHSNLWTLCSLLKEINIKISLLSTGIALEKHAAEVIKYCDDVIVSLDGSPDVHNKIRNIPNAFEKLKDGVKAIRNLDPAFRITGRCVLQKSNYHDFLGIVRTSREINLNEISFLAADVSSTAFNRPEPWQVEKTEQVALNLKEADELEKLIQDSFHSLSELYSARFITESPQKLLQIPTYYKALYGVADYPKQKCNAPWVSAVIESNGDVHPCFFHKPYGNIHEGGFSSIINAPHAIEFRKRLDVSKNSTCKKCVCSLHIAPHQKV